ncbi:MAG: polysaccharide pyruvyl transferase family protein [Synergistaceae bacterium]|nr:polysaccharide pyruvyl transferase family protein [Synergistaceae bacterium]
MRRYGAALIGYYGFGNLGDELLLKACIDLLLECGIGRERIAVLSNNPEDTSEKFQVYAVNRWSLREVDGVLRASERLIFGGGGIFQDRTSVKSCAWYWGITRLAVMRGVKVHAIGQSVGPLRSKLSRILTGDSLRRFGILHVRDERSLRFSESLGCRNVVRGCDLVMTLRPENAAPKSAAPKRMLVNLRPCPELERYVRILRGRINADTLGAALSPEDEEALMTLGINEIVRVRSFGEAEELWRLAGCAAGMRLHFGVLSRIFRTPLVMMPYDVKVNEFAEQSGVPCVSDEWIEPVMPSEIPASVNDETAEVFREIMRS